MFEYKDIQFYNDFCKSIEGFTLLEAFTKEEHDFVGKVIPNNTLYPVEIFVHIPPTFPHNKLTFRTKSISGYPHLIPYYNNPKLGNWFCLNTAFAETAEEQLTEEFDRLREWMQRQLRPELPQHIVDENTRSALRTFNIYEGENPDELNEIRKKGDFTFLGDFGKDPENFKEYGHLHAVKYQNNKFTIVEDKECSNYELPYVIVNHLPKNIHSFAAWVEVCSWSDELCQTLLPDFKWGENEVSTSQLKKIKIAESFEDYTKEMTEFNEEETMNDLAVLKEKLKMHEMPKVHKNALQKELDHFVQNKKESCEQFKKQWHISIDDEDYPDGPDPEDLWLQYTNKFHYFAIGYVSESNIEWHLVTTNIYGREEKKYTYDLERYIFEVKCVVEIRLHYFSRARIIHRDEYFGRGNLHSALSSKKIAIVGLGAIGSPLVESLVRGGVKELSLWDGDIVEAGNICRSTYDTLDIGNSKVQALANHLQKESPFCVIKTNGGWYENDNYHGVKEYRNGEFYGNINYSSQEKFITSLKSYDLIIDCTASNELLHFLSYAAKDMAVLSLCITNQSRDLLCISNHHGNPFELRKHYLACIEQETGNFYSEGTGCYSPTFLATYCDIQALTNLCVRTMNREFQSKGYMDSMIWHYDDNGISADKLLVYQLENSSITLSAPRSVITSIQHLPVLKNGENGYLLGGYNTERTSIYLTNVVPKIDAQKQVETMRIMSKGIIDYLGNVCLSSDSLSIPRHSQENIVNMAQSNEIDTNNPLVAMLAQNGEVIFALYIGEEFVPFHPID